MATGSHGWLMSERAVNWMLVPDGVTVRPARTIIATVTISDRGDRTPSTSASAAKTKPESIVRDSVKWPELSAVVTRVSPFA